MKLNFNILYKNIAYLFSCAIFFIFTSCEEDLTKRSGNENKNFPSQIIKNARIIQRDSGIITLKAFAPIIEKYELIDSPYVVARKGIEIEFFDKKNYPYFLFIIIFIFSLGFSLGITPLIGNAFGKKQNKKKIKRQSKVY